MTIEVRYIIFAPDEVHRAIVGVLSKGGHAEISNQIPGMKINGDAKEAVSVDVRIRHGNSDQTINLVSERLVGALLLFCKDHRMPIPRRAQKAVERSGDGLTLVLTTDLDPKNPAITGNHVTYAGIANYAQETSQARRELARAVEHAETARTMIAQPNARAKTAEIAAAEAGARLAAIRREPGLRGWLVRRLSSTTIRP